MSSPPPTPPLPPTPPEAHPLVLRRLRSARVGRLATVTEQGDPHLVPCCFVLNGDRVYTAVDGKPKRRVALRRLDNVSAHPAASLLVDHYDEDWSALWWVRVDGPARVLDPGPDSDAARALLRDKYVQYESVSLDGPVIELRITSWRWWP